MRSSCVACTACCAPSSQLYLLLTQCYDNGDCFALKQLVVLLLTYYVTHPRLHPE